MHVPYALGASAMLLVYAITTYVGAGVKSEIFSVAAWALPSILLLLCILFLGEQKKGISLLWENPFLVWVGNISFEFFLIHQLTIRYVEYVTKKLQLAVPDTLLYLGALGVALGCAAAVHRYRKGRMRSET